MNQLPESAYKPFKLPGANYYKLAKINIPDTVHLRYMTVSEIKYFTRFNEIDRFVEQILAACLMEKIDVDALLVGDKIYLLYMLRALTVDTKYAFDAYCASCGKVLPAEVSIFDMPVKEYDEESGYPLRVMLPKSGATVELALPNGRVEKEVDAEVKKFRSEFPNSEPDEPVYRLRRLLKSVNGVGGLEIYQFAGTMQYMDYKEIDKKLREVQPGLDLVNIVTCPHCAFENKITFSIQPKEFFLFGD